MKLLSSRAQPLCSIPSDSNDSRLVEIFAREYKRNSSLMQLVGQETLLVKHIRKESKEADNLEQLHRILPTEHLPRIYKVLQNEWLLMQKIQPVFASMHSFNDLLLHCRSVPLEVFQSCFAQVVALLCTAQASDPAFSHNDLKADNILLQRETRPSPLTIGQYRVHHVGVRVVLIDMETVTGSMFAPIQLPNITKEQLELFGIEPSMPYCQWTDLHLVCMEIWKRIKADRPKWKHDCESFLQSIVPTVQIFSTFEEGNIHFVTSMNRLSTKGRHAMNALMQKQAVVELSELWKKPFLEAFLQRDSPNQVQASQATAAVSTHDTVTHTATPIEAMSETSESPSVS